MPDDADSDGQWERVASELRACRAAQEQAWGGADNGLLGRYLADDVTTDERRRIESALRERPELRKLTDLVSDVLRECEPASTPEPAGRPAILPFRKAMPQPGAAQRRRRQWMAVAAAAGLLFALGYTVLPRIDQSPASWRSGDVAQAPNRDLDLKVAVALHLPTPRRGPLDHPVADAVVPSHDGAKDKRASEDAAQSSEATIPDPVVLACADGLDWAGERLQQAGDLDKAEWSYHLAHKIQVWKLGPDAPPTVETRQRLGDVYQVALNMPAADFSYNPSKTAPPAPSTSAPEIQHPAGLYVANKQDGLSNNGAYRLRERLTKQTPAEVRKSVVPVLVQNLRDAQTPLAREQFGRALAELGPAANGAVPALEECLAKAKSPEERAVVLRALGDMGPAPTANAAPALVTSLKSSSSVERRAAEEALLQYGVAARDAVNQVKDGEPSLAGRAEWENVKNRIFGAEGRAGVQDDAELFSPLALKEGRRLIRDLARDHQVEILAVTEGQSASAEDKAAKDRARDLGANGVAIVIRRSPVRVEVQVGQALRQQGFDDKQQERLRRLIETDVGRKDYDQGLLEGVRFLAQFQAEQAPPAKP